MQPLSHQDQQNLDRYIAEITRIRESAERDYDCLHSANGWTIYDARITALSKYINVLNSVWLALSNKEQEGHYYGEFLRFIKVGFVQSIFSVAETNLRILLRALDPTACNCGTAQFKSIYDCLIGRLSSKPANALELLDLLRNVRNTIHNNDMYFHRSGKNTQVIYKGKPYDFYHGQPVGFVTWDLLLMLTDDLRQLIVQIVSDNAFSGINIIEDLQVIMTGNLIPYYHLRNP